MNLHVTVDTAKCCGAGLCVMVAPEVFDQNDDDGVVVLLDDGPPAAQHAAVREAVQVCPAAAIEVLERV